MYTQFQVTYYNRGKADPFLTFDKFKNSILFVIDVSKQNESIKTATIDLKIELEGREVFIYSELYRQKKKHIHWLELLPRDVVNIIVKGKQKEDYFKASFPHCNVLNLENNNNNNVVSLVKCFHNGNNHSLMFCTCSKANVNQIINFLNKL